MRDLVDIHYLNAETIRIVQALRGAMYQTFPPPKPSESCGGASSTTPTSRLNMV
jgi:hypothetical protein